MWAGFERPAAGFGMNPDMNSGSGDFCVGKWLRLQSFLLLSTASRMPKVNLYIARWCEKAKKMAGTRER
jgi:hypothetical protein